MAVERHKYIGAVYLVLMRGEEILLSRRANTGYEDGNYSLVAGHMEEGEMIKRAIIREAEEEAGIRVAEEDLEIVTFLQRRTKPGRMDFFVKCEKWKGEIENKEQDKCSELVWREMRKLPENTVACVRRAIENYRAGIKFGEFGWKEGEIEAD